MAIKYPTSVKTDTDRVDFLYRSQEKLRLEHNAKGQAFRNSEISESEWLTYKAEFRAKNSALSESLAPLRTVVYETLGDEERVTAKTASKTDTKYDGDIDLEKVVT